jgi:hypothetical protein
MSDHEDIVRDFLDGNNVEGVRSARAALDALIAERDEWRDIAPDEIGTPGLFKMYVQAVEDAKDAAEAKLELRIEDDAVYRVYDEQVARAEAAEADRDVYRHERYKAVAEVARLREALEWIVNPPIVHDYAYEDLNAIQDVARAALGEDA